MAPGQEPGRDLQVVLDHAPTTRARPQSLIDTSQETFQLVADEAAELWRRPPGPGNALQVTAQQEAAEIRRQANAQATAIRSAAEREAAELRTATVSMSAELLRVARYVTENLSAVALPDAPPAVGPATRPKRELTDGRTGAAETAALTTTLPGTTRPRTTRPGPNTKGRQVANWHKALIALVLFGAVGAASGGTEMALHGFRFFEFRNAGAGAGNSQNLNENQGPGQPDAPGTQHPAKAPPKAKEHPKAKQHHDGKSGKSR